MRFEKHIFICTNQRTEGTRPSCGEACGMELVKEFKKQLKEQGLTSKMRAQRAGCLDACEQGPSLVVYPEGVFYGRVRVEDVSRIVSEHLVKGSPVKELQIRFPAKTDE